MTYGNSSVAVLDEFQPSMRQGVVEVSHEEEVVWKGMRVCTMALSNLGEKSEGRGI